jgi:molybdopterin converting factor small subunit
MRAGKYPFPARIGVSVQIIVKLFASLARFSPEGQAGNPFEIHLPEIATIQDVIIQLGIPTEETKISFVNGLIRDMDWVLQSGDEVGIFPPIGGG